MSFILDALKKLEQKRLQGSVPDLMTTHDSEPDKKKKRSLWPFLLLAALLLNTVFLMIWLRPWESEKPEIYTQSAVEQQHKQTKTEPVMESSITQLPELERPPDRDESNSHEIKESEKTVLTDPHTSDEKPVIEQERSMFPEQEVQAEAGGQEEVLGEPEPEDETIASIVIPPAVKEEVPEMNRTLTEDELSVNNKKESENKVLDINDLPQSVRGDLPDITISGHIYSDDPASRIVNINSRIIREGEFAAQNLKVTEITESGVIFSYQGLRFRMRAF
jgi:general secretion pathway protein B